MRGQTPSLGQMTTDAINSNRALLHTTMPGVVTAVNLAQGVCDVQPSLTRLDQEGGTQPLPIIRNCPIEWYRAGSAAILLPLAIGHSVKMNFCERSLDTWIEKGGTVNPADKRMHNLSDATVYPGLYAKNAALAADPKNLLIVNGSTKLTITPDGKFGIVGADDALAILSALIELLQMVETPTMLGPQTFLPSNISDLETLQTRIDSMRVS